MVWKALLLVYREVDAKLDRRRFQHIASEQEIGDARYSFLGFPHLVEELTSGAAGIDSKIIESREPLSSLTRRGQNEWWPSPDDTRKQLDHCAPAGKFDSVFIFWPQHDFRRRNSVPGFAWGLGMGASDWSNGATYATVANAPSANWKNEARGEVWLHEWLHGVCHHFSQRGHAMPERDADGAELHGYVRSPTRGWTEYYRDLMRSSVVENGRQYGIPLRAWEVLPPEEKRRANLEALFRWVAVLMDELIAFPHTKLKFGLDPLIGLIPGLGDTASATVSALLLIQAARRGVPKILLARMSLNILINELIGIIPGLGDAFSFWFKSNKRNYELLLAHSGGARRATKSDWLFVVAILAILFIIVGAGILVSLLVLRAIARMLGY